jgi:ribonuclease III
MPNTDKLCRSIGHSFNDDELIEQALTHRSAGGRNNERLEFLGDAILGFVIADILYHDFPEAKEGELSRLRAALVKRDTLAKIAREVELGDYLILGSGELRSGGHTRSSILADGVEALLGAIYLDDGYTTTRKIIRRLFSRRLENLTLNDQRKDPKTRLQELLQARKLDLPAYEVSDIKGEPHNQVFQVICSVEALKHEVTGSGSSRRKAEQDAASQLLSLIENG